MIKSIVEILQELGKAVSALAGMKAVSELATFFQTAVKELIEKEADIDAEIKKTLAKQIEECLDSAVAYLNKCEEAKKDWSEIESLINRKEYSGLVLRIAKLLAALGEVHKDYKVFAENIRSALDTVADLEKRCKTSAADCKLSKENTMTGAMVFGGLLVTVIYGSTAVNLVPSYLGLVSGPVFVIYNRFKWLNELDSKLEKHLAGLSVTVQMLEEKKKELLETKTEMDKLPRVVESAKAEIERTQKEHEREIAAAPKVQY